MHADLDTLCTVAYCTADDLLPERPGNGRRLVTDAEVATLCVAQAIMGIPSDRRFLAVARRRFSHLFPELPKQPGFHKRRARLTETIEWLVGVFAASSPGADDDLLLIDSTPVECTRSVETTRRSALADAAD
ncbi:MAG: Transposase domain [Solirubrobacterales bacterium]|nr:Transposase domain [Solirubrobacterales bacterium]